MTLSPEAKARARAELERRGVDVEAELAARKQERPHPTLADFVEGTVNFKLHDWQRKHLCPILERCVHEKGLRIAIHGPPQYGKSIIVSQRLPAWLIGIDPNHRVGLGCYNETRACEFGDVVKQIIVSPQYQAMFPGVRVKPDAPAGRFSTTKRRENLDAQPSFAAMGLLSGFTGRGVDTLILDDPYKSADEAKSETINEKVYRFWSETAKVRIDPSANVIVMFHRYHEDDFAGRLIEEGFEYLRFPAIADENEDGSDPTGRQPGELLSPMRSFEFLSDIEEADPMVWLGMFQGKPRPPEGGFIKRDYLRIGSVPPLDMWVRFWDFATTVKETGDYTASALCGIGPNQVFYVKDVVRFRAEWPEAFQIIVETTEREAYEAQRLGIRYVVGADANATQMGFVQQMMRHHIFNPEGEGLKVPLWPMKGPQDKKEKANGWVTDGRNGRLTLGLGPWNAEFIKECLAFTGEDTDKHDDQVDAVSGSWELIWQLKGKVHADKPKAEPGSQAWLDSLLRKRAKGH